MKTFKKFATIFLVVVLSVLLVRCGDDTIVEAPDVLFNVSGTVTYLNFAGTSQSASGAVIYLVKNATAASADYDLSAIADATGAYTFENLAVGDYYMFANFNTSNTNARVEGINFDSGDGFLFSVVDANITQDIVLSSTGQTTTMTVDTRENGDWNFDFTHSNIDFEFPYDENNASYSGRFNDFTMEVFFDPANLTTGSIEASIDLLSVNTSSPGGRDSFFDDALTAWDYGCLASTFGVSIDGVTLLPDEATRYATFSATGFEAYGDGYKATGTFTFNGMNHQETLFFRFIEGFEALNRQDVLTRFSSFEGKLDFNALTDYGIESSHLGGETVSVYISNQVTKAVQ